jgi:hypothetical protein
MSKYGIEQAKKAAIGFAEDSLSKGCLFKSSEMPEEDEEDWSKGDPENLETLASLVISDGVDGMEDLGVAESIVLSHLVEKFPEYA